MEKIMNENVNENENVQVIVNLNENVDAAVAETAADAALAEDEKAMAEAIEEAKNAKRESFRKSIYLAHSDLQVVHDVLDEIHALRRMKKLIDARILEISDDALQLAVDFLREEYNRDNGEFMYGGRIFEVSKKPVYDFVGHAPRYTMDEGVRYRVLQTEKETLSSLSKANTKEMATITSNFPLRHPDWAPDWTEYVLKCK